MRIEYTFELDRVEVPRFAVEAPEGIAKLYTLATLVMNVLATKPRVEIVFHGLNADDPDRKIRAFQGILESSSMLPRLVLEKGDGGSLPGQSTCYQWVSVQAP